MKNDCLLPVVNLIKKRYSGVNSVVLIGSSPTTYIPDGECMIDSLKIYPTIWSFLVDLFSRLKLRDREQTETILPPSDELLLTELSLMDCHKESKCAFSNPPSRKLISRTRRRLVQRHLHHSGHCPTPAWLEAVDTRYRATLNASSLVDRTALWSRVCAEFVRSVNVREMVLEETVYLLMPTMEALALTDFETTVLQQLLAEKALILQKTLNEEWITISHVDSSLILHKQEELKAENNIRGLFLDYLGLVVNVRDQIRLARILNAPDRGLNRHAFTSLKRQSVEKGLSLAQVALSFISRIRLGGKGYAPDPTNSLHRYTKGLGELVDFLNKLQDYVEEGDNSPYEAIVRCYSTVGKALATDSQGRYLRAEVDAVKTQLCEEAKEMFEGGHRSDMSSTPGRAVSDGGSVVGRRTMKAIRYLLDKEAMELPKQEELPQSCNGASPRTPSCKRSRLAVAKLFHTPNTPPTPVVEKRRRVLPGLRELDENSCSSMPAHPLFSRYQSNLDFLSARGEDSCPAFDDPSNSDSCGFRPVNYIVAAMQEEESNSRCSEALGGEALTISQSDMMRSNLSSPVSSKPAKSRRLFDKTEPEDQVNKPKEIAKNNKSLQCKRSGSNVRKKPQECPKNRSTKGKKANVLQSGQKTITNFFVTANKK